MARLKDIADISSRLESVDFWICMKGSEKSLGKVTKEKPEPTSSWIGIKVKEEYLDRVNPGYLYYVMMHLYNSGFYAPFAKGSLNLRPLTIEDVGSQIGFDLPEPISKTSRRVILKTLFKRAKEYWGSQGAGILFICKEDNTCLLGLRSAGVNEPGTWGIPGGAVEDGESAEVGAKREVEEEFGSLPSSYEKITQTRFEKDGFTYTTFVLNISKEEKRNWTKTIRLNWENERVKWFDFSTLPTNLHFGVSTLKDLLMEQSDLFLFPERKNSLDFYRNFLNEIKFSIKKENRQKLDSLINELSNEFSPETREDRTLGIMALIEKMDRLSEELLSADESVAAKKIKEAVQQIRKDLNRDVLEQDLSSQDQEGGKFLYHGTTFGDVLSILKTKSFHATGTYKKISFTTNFDLALKFGDTVLAFDAQSLKAKGARKMNYGTDQEIAQASSEGRDEDSLDHPKGPIISQIYKYEQEWSIKTPFTFTLNDLDRIYFVCDPSRKYGSQSNTYEEAMELVHQIVGDEVPLVCSNIKASAPFYPTFSARVSSGVVGLKSFLFKNISGSFSDLKDFRDEFINLFKKYNVSYHDYYRNDFSTYIHRLISFFSDINSIRQNLEVNYDKKELSYADAIDKLYKIITSLIGSSSFGEEGGIQVPLFEYRDYKFYFFPEEAQDDIKNLVNNVNNYVKQLLDRLKDEVSHFKDMSGESLNLDQEESVYNLLFRSSFSYLPPFISNQLNQKASALFEKIYDDYKTGKLAAYGDDYKIMSRIESLAMLVPPNAIPTELLKDRPIILIDHKNQQQFTDQQIIEALSEQDNYNAEWIFKYRLRIIGEDIFSNQEKAIQDFKEEARSYPEVAKEVSNKIRNDQFFIKVFRLLGRQDLLDKIDAIKNALLELEKETLVTARAERINQLLKKAKAARD